jgi:hypothetical protein
MNPSKLSQVLKMSSVVAAICVLVASLPIKAQEVQRQIVQPTPEILSVPCFDGGGSGGWMYENLPDEYFPVGLVAANQWPTRSVRDHPMYNSEAPWNKYATCVIVPASQPTSIAQSTPEILSVPCFDGGGSGGWMYENLPNEYFPVGLVAANQWPTHSLPDHPMYSSDEPWNKYATCVIVPASSALANEAD